MKFEPANQNGKITPTQLKSKQSKFGLIVSHTGTVYGRPLYLKALSDAAMYKTVPVTFYGQRTGDPSAITIGTSTFQTTAEAILATTSLGTGTWNVWATWPGEGIYAEKTTLTSPITIGITGGATLGGAMTISSTPASGNLVITEGSGVFTATLTTSTLVPGSMYWLVNGVQVATIPILDNKTTLTFTNFITGTNSVQAVWPAGDIGGTLYEAKQATISYNVLAGSTVGGSLVLSVTPVNYGILNEGTITLNAVLTTSTSLPGNVTFYSGSQAIYTAPVVNNSATFVFANTGIVGNYSYSAVWDGNQSSNPRYITKTSNSVGLTIKARETIPSMTLTVDPALSDYSLPVRFTAVLNTSTTVNTGSVTFLLDNNVLAIRPVNGFTATYETNALSTGTYLASAYYGGSTQTPKYYPVYSNTVTTTVTQGVYIGAPLILNVISDSYVGPGAPYVTNETITLTASINTATQINDYVRFSINGETKAFVNFTANNTATTTTLFTSSGTYNIQALWDGTEIGGTFYAGQSTSTNIFVAGGYTMPNPLVLTSSQPRVIDENIVFTATVTTSSGMLNTVTFYANTLTLGTAQFNSTTNKAILTTSIANSGTYTIQAIWSGGYIDSNRFYLPLASSTSSMFVDYAADFLYPITVNISSSTNSVGSSTILTAVINTTTNLSGVGAGTITFRNTNYNRVIGTSTISTNVGSIVVPGDTFSTASNYTWSAEWSGSTAAPKFKAKSTTTTSTLVARSVSYPRLVVADFYRNDTDGFTIKNIQTATVSVTGTYLTHQPTGDVELYDGAQFISTATLSNGVAEFSWLPTAFNQLDSGTRTLNAVYLRDSWNSTASTTATFVARTRRPTTMTMSISNTATFRPNTAVLNIAATSTYFNSKVLDIVEGTSIVGQASFVGSTATYTIDTSITPLGTRSYYARFNQDFAYDSTVSNTVTFTVSKSTVPITLTINNTVTSRPNTIFLTAVLSGSFNVPKTITVFDNGNTLTTITTMSGVFYVSTSSSLASLGTHNYHAQFVEDNDYNGYISNTVTTVVSKGNIPITLDLNTASMTIPYEGGDYQIRQPELVKFRSKTTASVTVPRPVTIRSGTGVKFNWFTATHVGTLTEITTSSSYFDLESLVGGLYNGEYFYEYQRQETYDIVAPETNDYTSATSNTIIIDTGRKMLSPLTITAPSAITKPENLQVTLASTGTDWIGRTVNLYSFYRFQGSGSYSYTTLTNILSTITFTSNVMTATISHTLLPANTSIVLSSNLKPTYQAQAWSTNSNYLAGDQVFYEGSNWYYITNYTYNSFIGPKPPSALGNNIRKITDIVSDYQSLGSNQVTVGIALRSPQILIEGPRAPNFTLRYRPDEQTNFIIANNFDRQFMAGQNLLFTATTTATYMEGKSVNLIGTNVGRLYPYDNGYRYTLTSYLSTGTIVNGQVTFTWPTIDTRVPYGRINFVVVYPGDDTINYTGSINTWTQNQIYGIEGWQTDLNSVAAYNNIEIKPSTSTVYTNTTVVITGTVANSTFRDYLEGKPISWSTGTGLPIATTIMTNGNVELVVTGTNVPNNLRISYYDNIWIRDIGSPLISFTKIP